MKPNKKDTEKLFDIYCTQKGKHDPIICMVKFKEGKLEEIKGKSIYDYAMLEIQLYREEKMCDPKYIFINPITYKHLKDYVKKQGMFCIARELGHSTEYFRAVEIIVCDIEDDEVVVGG